MKRGRSTASAEFRQLYLDKRSGVYQQLAVTGKFGVFNALIGVPVHEMASFRGFTEKERADLRRQPLFISLVDPA